ncbi:MAG TPA: DUF444 family protein, partial [Gemmatales bacterium]|nr:DUF444 family protein [Gemmatales bacterium]
IIHDAAAKEVDENTFYHTRESGGTKISTAYDLADKIISKRFPPSEWNIYAFHFSDGDNWGDDNEKCLSILQERLLPKLNLFGYAQVESPYGSGEFMEHIESLLENYPQVIATKVPDKESILGCWERGVKSALQDTRHFACRLILLHHIRIERYFVHGGFRLCLAIVFDEFHEVNAKKVKPTHGSPENKQT